MTAETFDAFWAAAFPHTAPPASNFRHDYPDRWLRIHSLPASKRYAATPEEWAILLNRQNTVLTELLGDATPVLLVTGDYGNPDDAHVTATEPVFRAFTFHRAAPVPQRVPDATPDAPPQIYRPAFSERVWRPHHFDPLLRKIANDEIEAFFVHLSRNRMVAPYNGGIDCILEDTAKRDFYRSRYSDWLSDRADGL